MSLSIVLVGEVDHGKSSVVGRLLHDTGTIPENRVENVRKICKEQGKEFEYAFLLDAFEEEQRQGITIDISHIQFATAARGYRLIDAPGHREFLKNMVSGSASADAAILLIDAKEGAREQSRRHSYLLKLLGIRSVLVCVNKMDLVGYASKSFEAIRDEHNKYLTELGIQAKRYIPVSARFGVNISKAQAKETPWYKGPSLLGALDELPDGRAREGAPARFSVQDVYKWDEKRIIAGRLESGTLAAGQEVRVWPADRVAKIASIERWNGPGGPAVAGESVGITLTEQAFVERGNIVSLSSDAVSATTLLDANIFWMGKKPLALHAPVKIKLLSQETDAQVTRIHRIIDTSSLQGKPAEGNRVARHEVAEVTLSVTRPIAADAFAKVPESGRFVLVDEGRVSGGGIITSPLSAYSQITKPTSRNIGWEFSQVTAAERAARNGHRGCVIWLTGLSGAGKSTLSKALEAELFRGGRQVFVLDGDNMRHGLNADLGFSPESRTENIRRVGEVARLFAEAGQIVVTAFISPYRADRDRVRRILDGGNFFEVYLKCPIEVCESRDPKGLYRKARQGQLPEFTGITSPYEEPVAAELVLDSSQGSPEDWARQVLRVLEGSGVFRGGMVG